jgi:hypothetical protein
LTKSGSKAKISSDTCRNKTVETSRPSLGEGKASQLAPEQLNPVMKKAKVMKNQEADGKTSAVCSDLAPAIPPATVGWPIMDVAPATEHPNICRAVNVPVQTAPFSVKSKQGPGETTRQTGHSSTSTRKELTRDSPAPVQQQNRDHQQRETSRSQSRRPAMWTSVRRYPFYPGRWARTSNTYRRN